LFYATGKALLQLPRESSWRDSTQDVHHPPGLAKGVNRQVEQTWESLSISKKLQDDNKNTEASQRVF
jgi:hypothetical protein